VERRSTTAFEMIVNKVGIGRCVGRVGHWFVLPCSSTAGSDLLVKQFSLLISYFVYCRSVMPVSLQSTVSDF
jgi:hypothetical protein